MAGIGNHMQRSGRPGRVISVAAPEEGRAASKADAAFEEFVRARSAHLLRLALLLTGWNGAVAEDLTQTALDAPTDAGGRCSAPTERPSPMYAACW